MFSNQGIHWSQWSSGKTYCKGIKMNCFASRSVSRTYWRLILYCCINGHKSW